MADGGCCQGAGAVPYGGGGGTADETGCQTAGSGLAGGGGAGAADQLAGSDGGSDGGGAGDASAVGIFVPQAPQKTAVSYTGEPQLPQNFAIAELPCVDMSALPGLLYPWICRGAGRGKNRFLSLPALRGEFWQMCSLVRQSSIEKGINCVLTSNPLG